jgi:membrane-bound lytic murein transglycosylase A
MAINHTRTAPALAAALLMAACAASPSPSTTTPRPPAPGTVTPQPLPLPPPPVPLPPPPPAFTLTDSAFAAIPGWAQADLAPALSALKRQCAVYRNRTPDSPLPGGQYTGRYGAITRDWMPACDAALTVAPGQERWFFESFFMPSLVGGTGERRLTAYYEPVIPVSATLATGYSEPLLKRPSDMVTIDISAFAAVREDDALRGAPRALTGKLNGDRVEPYPKRAAIAPAPGQVIAYAHPADVYNLQIQGSGRIRYPDGRETRAAFAAQNGYTWKSALGALRNAGELAAATWANFRTWLDANPSRTREVLGADPSYVFFTEETITDYAAGPKGAAGIPLTGLGSMAVDPAYHPYGALIFVDGMYDGAAFRRLMVAQDTGGAIRRGPMRGDIFFGSGTEAGRNAERMNAPATWWTLLPIEFSAPIASSGAVQTAGR